MVETTTLGLPLLAGNQAQKHVTVNEALQRIDALAQLTLQSKDIIDPPAAAEGQVWAVPAGATGAWDGWAGHLALWLGAGWLFVVPGQGWSAFIVDLGVRASFDGSEWVPGLGSASFHGAGFIQRSVEIDHQISSGTSSIVDRRLGSSGQLSRLWCDWACGVGHRRGDHDGNGRGGVNEPLRQRHRDRRGIVGPGPDRFTAYLLLRNRSDPDRHRRDFRWNWCFPRCDSLRRTDTAAHLSMQMPLHVDAVAAARVLRGAPLRQRAFILRRMLREAERANDWKGVWRRPHPMWGDGSLLAAALRRQPAPEPVLVDAEYCRCLALVYAALGARCRT